MNAERIEAEVRALERLDLHGLRAEWTQRWGRAPKHRSAALLRYQIAWRIQAAAFGGIDQRLRKALLSEAKPGPPRVELTVGTRLMREWKGIAYEVEVKADGYFHAGQTYRSLSEVARTITGTRWNGLRFFGLREAPKA